MARVDPTDPNAPATPQPFDPLATDQAVEYQNPTDGPAHTAENEQRLRDAAARLGMDFEKASPDELEFFAVFSDGGLDSIQPDADPDNPLIPGDTPTQTTPVAPADAAPVTPTADAPPPATGADDRVGPATTPDDGGGSVAPTVVSPLGVPSPEATVPPPGLPAFDVPSTLPPPLAQEPVQPEPQEQLVQLADGSLVTLSTYQALVAQQQVAQQQAAQQQYQPQQFAQPNAQPQFGVPAQPQGQVPNAWSTTPGEYVDERAAYEIASIQQQLAATQQTIQRQSDLVAQQVEQQRQQRVAAIAQAAEETKAAYGVHRGLSAEQAEDLFDNALRLNLVGVYSQLYPEDPRRAVAAALENVYWQTPALRDLEVARRVEATRAENAEAERKRALASQTVSAPGSVSRTSAPARTTAERDAGMVALIEADPTYVARQSGTR